MTENEAIKYLKLATDEAGDDEFSDIYKEMCSMAIQALEGIQQYRAIGTIKEFKALKEKNEEKRVIGIDAHLLTRHCPSCSEWMGFEIKRGMKYCPNCGQKLNWRGEKQ